jgi:hypothetical protein
LNLRGWKTLAYLLMLVALATSQPADLLRQASAVLQAACHTFY